GHHVPVLPLNDLTDATFGSLLPRLNDCLPRNNPHRGRDAWHDDCGLRALMGGLVLGSMEGYCVFRVGAEHVVLDRPAPEPLGEDSEDWLPARPLARSVGGGW